jgi:hypothetical protein
VKRRVPNDFVSELGDGHAAIYITCNANQGMLLQQCGPKCAQARVDLEPFERVWRTARPEFYRSIRARECLNHAEPPLVPIICARSFVPDHLCPIICARSFERDTCRPQAVCEPIQAITVDAQHEPPLTFAQACRGDRQDV